MRCLLARSAAVGTLLLVVSACTGGTPSGGPTTPSTQSGSSAPSSPKTPAAPSESAAAGTVTKLLVFVEENHTMEQMRDGMPYTFGLAERYGYATDYSALTHPSLPNYIAIAGGDTYGITDDDSPSDHPLDGSSVFGQAIERGKTAAVYADGMPENCAVEDGGDDYAVKHNPWAYFVNEADMCRANDVPVTELDAAITEGRLPNVAMVVPNRCNDAHDCDLSVADDWFKGYMEEIFAGPDWKSGHLAVVVTADEDDRSADNRVLTVVIHPSQHANVVTEPLDHYSLTRLYDDVIQAPYLKQAESATSMADAFGLPVG